MDKNQIGEKLNRGLNCSQRVFLEFSDRYGLGYKEAKAIAEAFGGGMARGATCGAVTGAYLVLGLEYGRGEEDSRVLTKSKVREFNTRFIERMGSLTCEDLLGGNISTEEGLREVRQNNRMDKICPKAIKTAIEILEEMTK